MIDVCLVVGGVATRAEAMMLMLLGLIGVAFRSSWRSRCSRYEDSILDCGSGCLCVCWCPGIGSPSGRPDVFV